MRAATADDRQLPVARVAGTSLRSTECRTTRALRYLVLAGVVMVPLIVVPGQESFRSPKEMVVRAEAILAAAIVAAGWLWGDFKAHRTWLRERPVQLTLLIIGWTVVTALFASNGRVAIASTLWVVELAIVFLATYAIAPRLPLAAAALPLCGAVISGVLSILQATGVWQPFQFNGNDPRIAHSGLIGNPNDLGSYLLFATIAAVTLSTFRSRWRWLAAATATFLVFAIFVTQTLTAVIAVGAALLIVAVRLARSRKRLVAVIAVAAIVAGAAAAYQPQLSSRLSRLQQAIAAGKLDDAVSSRGTAWVAAAMMAADHPILGVGPGCFKWDYFDYKTRAEARFPQLRQSGAVAYNFGEAHNDHLQVAAQSGLVGYGIFVLASIFLAAHSWRANPQMELRRTFAVTTALPLAVGFAILAVGQFPLELAAPSHTAFFYVALIARWGES